eukprot:2966438-Amphidinium_carterae.1
MEEVHEYVASYAASRLKRTSRAKLSWRKKKTGRRRARRAGSGVTQSSLPTRQEEKACDAFLERIDVAEPDDFERRGLDGRTIFTRTLRSLSGTSGCWSSGTSNAGRTRMRSTSSSWRLCSGRYSEHISLHEEYLVCCAGDEENLVTFRHYAHPSQLLLQEQLPGETTMKSASRTALVSACSHCVGKTCPERIRAGLRRERSPHQESPGGGKCSSFVCKNNSVVKIGLYQPLARPKEGRPLLAFADVVTTGCASQVFHHWRSIKAGVKTPEVVTCPTWIRDTHTQTETHTHTQFQHKLARY